MTERKRDSLILRDKGIHYWGLLVIKWALILLLVIAGFFNYVKAQENYTVVYSETQNRESLIALRSNINYHAYCNIIDGRGYLVAEFHLAPYATSRYYYEPAGRWTWSCT